MKKVFLFVLVAVMALAFTACGNNSLEQTKSDFCVTFIRRYNEFVDEFNLSAPTAGFNELEKVLELNEENNYSFDPTAWSHLELNFDEKGKCYVVVFGTLAQSTIMPDTNFYETLAVMSAVAYAVDVDMENSQVSDIQSVAGDFLLKEGLFYDILHDDKLTLDESKAIAINNVAYTFKIQEGCILMNCILS